MSNCEMCGKQANLVTVSVELVEMKVCNNCTKYGQVKSNNNYQRRNGYNRHIRNSKPEEAIKVKNNYAHLIKSARESRSMNQEEFAKFLQEKESIVAKWEHGTLKPQISTAKFLQRKLNVNLLESDTKQEFKPESKSKRDSDELTLGDIKIKKRN